MKTLIQFLLATSTTLACVCCETTEEEKTDDKLDKITPADPTIFVGDGKHYFAGTYDREPNRFVIFESTDLEEWKTANGDTFQLILHKEDSAYGEREFWAPQLFKEGDRYYLTYTVSEHTALTSSNSIYDPSRQDSICPIDEMAKNIGSLLFRDSDGRHYLYHVRFNEGNYLWVVELDLQKGRTKSETLKRCFGDTEAWEKTPNYKSALVMKGPTVIKLNDLYYLFYSVNRFRNIDYAVGYATSTSSYSPWKKRANDPIIHRSIIHENGSGYGDLFKGLGGRYYYVYRVHHSDSIMQLRKTRIVPSILKKKNDIYSITIDKENTIEPTWE